MRDTRVIYVARVLFMSRAACACGSMRAVATFLILFIDHCSVLSNVSHQILKTLFSKYCSSLNSQIIQLKKSVTP